MPSAFVMFMRPGVSATLVWGSVFVSIALCLGSVVEKCDSNYRLVRLEAHETERAAVLIGGQRMERWEIADLSGGNLARPRDKLKDTRPSENLSTANCADSTGAAVKLVKTCEGTRLSPRHSKSSTTQMDWMKRYQPSGFHKGRAESIHAWLGVNEVWWLLVL